MDAASLEALAKRIGELSPKQFTESEVVALKALVPLFDSAEERDLLSARQKSWAFRRQMGEFVKGQLKVMGVVTAAGITLVQFKDTIWTSLQTITKTLGLPL